MSEVKFSVSNGQWTIIYEGETEFLKSEFRFVLENLLESPALNVSSGIIPRKEPLSDGVDKIGNRQIQQMTINNLCAKLNCQTGTELVLAACIFLTFMANQDSLPRRDILQAMKEASRYYKDTYAGNLSSSLQTLINKKQIMERSQEVYVLTPAYYKEIEGQLV